MNYPFALDIIKILFPHYTFNPSLFGATMYERSQPWHTKNRTLYLPNVHLIIIGCQHGHRR